MREAPKVPGARRVRRGWLGRTRFRLYLFTVKKLITALLVCLIPELAAAESGETVQVRRTPEAVLSAFLYAYPDKIGTIDKDEDTWTVQIGESVFLWAGGRLIPKELKAAVDDYTAYPFYTYHLQLPPIVELSPEEKQRLEERIAHRQENPSRRHPGIYNAIWRIKDEKTAWNQAKTAFIFGHKLTIHRDLLDELGAIEEELMARAAVDRELLAYIESIRNVEGYSWRRIAETVSLSYHSYGAAIDFLPRSTDGKGVYWLWQKQYDTEWYRLPYDRRHAPPDSFIEAFERRGFIWGGKWFYYDTMHFEYRPEILALNGWLREERPNPVTGVVETVWLPPTPRGER